jgi:Tfp pilus assembly protein PilV
MKARFFGKAHTGLSTIEILIAFTILTLSISAVVIVMFGNQSLTIDTQTNVEALAKAQSQLEDARAIASQNFDGAITIPTYAWTPPGGRTYSASTSISDLTQCKKQATSTVSWQQGGRIQSVELTSYFVDLIGALALGSDCPVDPPEGWTNPQRFASDTFSPGKPTAIDVLQKIVYLGSDKSPFLEIADTRGATLGQTNGLLLSHGLSIGTYPNSLDAIRWYDPSLLAYRTFVFAAMHDTTNQLKVIETTVPGTPVLQATRALSGCVLTTSFPQGWLVYYYKGMLYLTVRETAGPELHVFDVSTPSNPTELPIGSAACAGQELNTTVEGLVVQDQVISGVTHRYAYMATDSNIRELMVWDVTDPLAMHEVTAARQDLSGNTDAASVYAIGRKLFLGRLSAPGADLYVYDTSNPEVSLAALGQKDIGTGVTGIRVMGSLAFLSTPKTNQEFQVWNVKQLDNISLIKAYNFGNIVSNGVDYEPDFIYTTGDSTPNFQILYSAP